MYVLKFSTATTLPPQRTRDRFQALGFNASDISASWADPFYPVPRYFDAQPAVTAAKSMRAEDI